MNPPSSPSSTSRRHLPGALLVAWLALDAVVFWLCAAWTLDLLPYLEMLLLGQFLATSGWAVAGEGWNKSSAAYAACLPIFGVLAAVVLGLLPWDVGLLKWLVGSVLFTTTYGLLLNLPLVLARVLGWRFRWHAQPLDRRAFYQFSLSQFLVYTALVALIAASWAATRPSPVPATAAATKAAPRPVPRPGGAIMPIGAMNVPAGLGRFDREQHLAFVLIGFPIPWMLWAVFAYGSPLHAGPLAAALTGFWGVVLGGVLGFGWTTGLLLVPAATLIVHLQALRIAGFGWERGYRAAAFFGDAE